MKQIKTYLKRATLIIVFALFCFQTFGQEQSDTIIHAKQFHENVYPAVIHDGDTIPAITLPVARIYAKRIFKTKADEKYYYRLKKKVIKVYPYALIAAKTVNQINDTVAKIKKKRKAKKYINSLHKKLEGEFKEALKNMYVSEGKILMKLIERETGEPTYKLIKDMKNGVVAFVSQKAAQLYGTTLKIRYDPKNVKEDKLIESILIRAIDEGKFDEYLYK